MNNENGIRRRMKELVKIKSCEASTSKLLNNVLDASKRAESLL